MAGKVLDVVIFAGWIREDSEALLLESPHVLLYLDDDENPEWSLPREHDTLLYCRGFSFDWSCSRFYHLAQLKHTQKLNTIPCLPHHTHMIHAYGSSPKHLQQLSLWLFLTLLSLEVLL